MFVDEVVGNVWIEQVEQRVGAGHGQRFMAREPTPFETPRRALASTYNLLPDALGE
jgi:hypothetical protein